MASALRRVGKLALNEGVRPMVLICDVQERFRGLIYKFDSVVRSSVFLCEASRVLNVPVFATEQNPKALGKTVTELDRFEFPRVSKMEFSMLTKDLKDRLNQPDAPDSFLIVGLETHVCVLQTCLDLIEAGKTVHVVVDGVSSQRTIDRDVALKRLENAGAFLTTSESAVFMLMKTASHEKFKDVSKAVKEWQKAPSELNLANL